MVSLKGTRNITEVGCKPTILLRDQDWRANPFDLPGEKGAVLLLHGFTGTPAEVRPVGEILSNDFGFRALGPLLPGHGTVPDDLIKCRAEDWRRTSEEAFLSLRTHFQKVHVVGLSMGGCLALELFQLYPKEVASLTLLVPPVWLRTILHQLALRFFRHDWACRLIPMIFKEMRIQPGQIAYDCYPTRTIREFAKLMRHEQKLERMDSPPTFIAYTMADKTVHPRSAAFLAERLRNPANRLLKLEKSFHVITVGSEKEKLFSELKVFFRGQS